MATPLTKLPPLLVPTTPEQKNDLGLDVLLNPEAVLVWFRERRDLVKPVCEAFFFDLDERGTSCAVCLVGLVRYSEFGGDLAKLSEESDEGEIEHHVGSKYVAFTPQWKAYVQGLISGWDYPYSLIDDWKPIPVSGPANLTSQQRIPPSILSSGCVKQFRWGIVTAQQSFRLVSQAGIKIYDAPPGPYDIQIKGDSDGSDPSVITP